MLEETPWVRQAQAESQARRNVGILFDDNRLERRDGPRRCRSWPRCSMRDGAWPWFPGGPPNDYITLYITTGFGRLRHLGVKFDMAPALKSLARLDGWIDEIYREILQQRPQGREPSQPDDRLLPLRPQLLPGRPADRPAGTRRRSTTSSARPGSIGCKLADRQSQGHLAVALKRFGDKPAAAGHHALDQGAVGQRRRAGHVLARHGAVVGGGIAPRSKPRP